MTCVRSDDLGACRILRLERLDKLNALDGRMLDAIEAALESAEASPARAIVVTGSGDRAFSAGADLAEIVDMSASELDARNDRARALFDRLARSRLVTVAALNGAALGGGLELALACTFRIAVAGAKMGLPEVTLGVMPTYGGTQRLPRVLGTNRALELMLTGRRVTAEEAHRIGLVDRLVRPPGDVVAESVAFLQPIVANSLAALGHIKTAALAADDGMVQGLRAEGEIARLACRTGDAREGISAFIDKRTPLFRDA